MELLDGEVSRWGGFDTLGDGDGFSGVVGDVAAIVEEGEVETKRRDFTVEGDVFEGA